MVNASSTRDIAITINNNTFHNCSPPGLTNSAAKSSTISDSNNEMEQPGLDQNFNLTKFGQPSQSV